MSLCVGEDIHRDHARLRESLPKHRHQLQAVFFFQAEVQEDDIGRAQIGQLSGRIIAVVAGIDGEVALCAQDVGDAFPEEAVVLDQ